MKKFALLLLLAGSFNCYSQDHGFPFGKITYKDLDAKTYTKDTTAVAVVLDEFGEAYIDNSNGNNLLFEYHVKIKILKKEGLRFANFEIPLYKYKAGDADKLNSVKASSFNHTAAISEDKMDERKV